MRDRLQAFTMGVPHGYDPTSAEKKAIPIRLRVVSELHAPHEYGPLLTDNPQEETYEREREPMRSGSWVMKVDPDWGVDELRRALYREGGIVPAICLLSFAGKHLDDARRSLRQYGVLYWHEQFPEWPLVVRGG